MKNKKEENNVTVQELINTIVELQDKKNNREFAHSYALGTLQAIMDWELKGYTNGLQNAINRAYVTVKEELDELNKPKKPSLTLQDEWRRQRGLAAA